jgi:hypothetical protein
MKGLVGLLVWLRENGPSQACSSRSNAIDSSFWKTTNHRIDEDHLRGLRVEEDTDLVEVFDRVLDE